MQDFDELFTLFRGSTLRHLKGKGKSQRSISKSVTKNPSWLGNALDEDAKREPGFFRVVKLARELGVTPNDLCGMSNDFNVAPSSEQRIADAAVNAIHGVAEEVKKKYTDSGTNVNVKSLVSWWQETGGRIEALGSMADHIDLYEIPGPTDGITNPIIMGRQSLATKTLDSNSTDHLRYVLRAFKEPDRLDLVAAYSHAASEGAKFGVETIDVHVPELDQVIQYSYFRTLLRCKDPVGNEYILNCSEFLGCFG